MKLFNNQLHFYLATLYEIIGDTDSRLRVRILPEMIDYEDTSLLPCFPPLFKNTTLNGKSEKDDGVSEAENYLILSNDDWTFGWVVCKANLFSLNSDSEKIEFQNPNFKIVEDNIKSCKFGRVIPDYDYKNLVVQTLVFEDESNASDGGGMIEFYNFRTGDKFIFNASGSGMCITSWGVKLFAGKQTGSDVPANQSAEGKHSSITLMPAECLVKVERFEVDAHNIIFGHGNRKLLASSSTQPLYAEGKDILSIFDKTGDSVSITV